MAEKINNDSDLEGDELTNYIVDGFAIMKEFRGELIENGIQLSLVMEDTIANYLISDDKQKNDFLRDVVLDSRNVTVFQIIDIYKKLGLHTRDIFEGKYNDLIKRLKWFFEARNKFAHKARDSYHHDFVVLWKGREERKILDDNFREEIQSEFQYLISSLVLIRHEFGLLIPWQNKE